MTDHEPDVDQHEAGSRNNEEVHGADGIAVIAKEGRPALAVVDVGFLSVREARLVVESWRREDDERRPRGAFEQTTPAACAAGVEEEQGEAA